jgi:hypothetical protein
LFSLLGLNRCIINCQAGDCVMPKEGVFARILRGRTIKPQSTIEVLRTPQRPAAPGGLVEVERRAVLPVINHVSNELPEGERVA